MAITRGKRGDFTVERGQREKHRQERVPEKDHPTGKRGTSPAGGGKKWPPKKPSRGNKRGDSPRKKKSRPKQGEGFVKAEVEEIRKTLTRGKITRSKDPARRPTRRRKAAIKRGEDEKKW